MAWRARDDHAVDRVLGQTGSRIDARQRALYARLFRRSAHNDAALALMANWDLDALKAELGNLPAPLTLLNGTGDGMVPPPQGREVAAMVPDGRAELLSGLGHLAHEEAPERVAAAVLAALKPSDRGQPTQDYGAKFT